MVSIFLIHGAYGSPDENWIPWLKEELEKLNCRVFVPKFPTPDGQTLDGWIGAFSEYKKYFDENSIVVGHSLGVAFLLNVLENIEKPVKAAFFVSGFVDFLNNKDFDIPNKTFIDRGIDWKSIRKNCKTFFVFHSDNDPYVPLEKAKKIADCLGVDIILVNGAGHFNTEMGYNKFDLLLEGIKNEL
jgi:uncharacterized protein